MPESKKVSELECRNWQLLLERAQKFQAVLATLQLQANQLQAEAKSNGEKLKAFQATMTLTYGIDLQAGDNVNLETGEITLATRELAK